MTDASRAGGDTPSPGPAGLLLVDKPEGPTSMDICRRVRRALVAGGAPKRVKVGHGGTLDPLATGLVVVLVGRATKLCDAVMAGEKHYDAEIDLARTSTTDDREGEIAETPAAEPPGGDAVRGALAGFVGEIMQRPPAHSAVWVGGERAYKLARRGRLDALEPRPVTVHEITLLAYDWPVARVAVRCGKGTYIRSLARDIGAALGVGGMLRTLRRTGVGPHRVEAAAAFDRLPGVLTSDDLAPLPAAG